MRSINRMLVLAALLAAIVNAQSPSETPPDARGCTRPEEGWLPAQKVTDAVTRPAPDTGRPALSLHYVANAGVLVAAGRTRILIDALFDRPNPAYRAPSADTIEKMVNGTAPFDGVGLALVTHNHPDHFDARVALRFLESRRDAVLMAPADAVEAMRGVATEWSRLAPRIVPIDGPVGHQRDPAGPGCRRHHVPDPPRQQRDAAERDVPWSRRTDGGCSTRAIHRATSRSTGASAWAARRSIWRWSTSGSPSSRTAHAFSRTSCDLNTSP